MAPHDRDGDDWLGRAVIYEIYPQSFADSNGDGIGDLPGALGHLDHLVWLGVDTVWFNPCFASPFVDAGYDVSDYLTVAPRYGSNADLVAYIDAARDRGIRVLLDLVVGHTSVEHDWFRAEVSGSGDGLGDRYIWRDDDGEESDLGVLGSSPWVASPGPRGGRYLKNFFDAQPALNFGYARLRDDEPWRQPVDAPGPQRNRRALREIMAFWLDRGAAGFRVDMAFSLVKDDDGLVETTRLWREARAWLTSEYPGTVLIPEGVEPPATGEAAFDADYLLVIGEEHSSLFNNGGAGRLPHLEPAPCFFDADGAGDFATFLSGWQRLRTDRPGRQVLLGSADHDFSRLACGSRDEEQLGAAFTFLLTWGSVPVIYYGDEIGMRYRPGLPDVEGSVCHPGFYNRAGARTPMQWGPGRCAGFSSAPPDSLYLPIDPAPDRVTVEGQIVDPDSVLNVVRDLIRLRREQPALATDGDARVLNAGYPLVYLRGGTHLVVVNPRREPAAVDLRGIRTATLLFGRDVLVGTGTVTAAGFGYGVFHIDP